MDIPPLPIKLVRQNLANLNCLQSCALMVLNYFKVSVSPEELRKRVHFYQKHSGLFGSFLTDFGRLAIKKKLTPTISHYDWQWWDQETAEVTSQRSKLIKQIKALRKRKTDWGEKKIHTKEVQYLKAGGKFCFEKPRLNQIDFWLQKQLPVVLRVWSADFYHLPGEDYANIIVVVGKRGNDYFIKDPQLALKVIDEADLLIAWTRAGNWLLAVTPQPKSETEDQLPLFASKSVPE
jgi:ABC-type bacteriocin/lantibiotic exporter with double-glycine peptidase domain